MNVAPILDIFESFVLKAITVLLPASGVSVVVVIVFAIIMAMVQIQDQSLTFLPKALSIIAVIVILGPWMLGQMTDIILETLTKIPDLIKV